ncbi:DUF2887 domain-containing protein [Egbenema bharatensis]|uniref:DUF2887 domain-containing protein n=1 Tax=Egbenema bharatensis TaxID=3463334 RepID=UPI003A8A5AB3
MAERAINHQFSRNDGGNRSAGSQPAWARCRSTVMQVDLGIGLGNTNRNRDRFYTWHVVVIYPARSVEQSQFHPYQALLNSEQVNRVYLDELGEIRMLSLWLAVMVLTTVGIDQAPDEARYLLDRTRQEVSEPNSRAIMELITTIVAYRFDQLSRREIEAMLDITLQETRVYREIKEEGREEG